MANIPTINLTADAARKLLTVWVDVSEGTGSPLFEVQGYKVEDMSIEYNPDTETITDILGDTYTTLNKLERAMSFAPNTLRAVSNRGKLNQILHEHTRRNNLSALSNFKVLVVYGYIGDSTAGYAADLFPECTIIPQSLGGSSKVDFPYDINPGGATQYGTVDKLTDGLMFTPETI